MQSRTPQVLIQPLSLRPDHRGSQDWHSGWCHQMTKVPSRGKPCSLVAFLLLWLAPGPEPGRIYLLPGGYLFVGSRGLSRFAAGLVAESMDWLSGSIKEVACEWVTHMRWATWREARLRRAPGSWERAMLMGTGSQGAISLICLEGHNLTHPPLKKNQLSFILILRVGNIYCRKYRLWLSVHANLKLFF